MKIAIDVKNLDTKTKISPNSILLYDGKEYYLTTVSDLYASLENKINNAIEEYAKREQNLLLKFNELNTSVGKQIYDMATIIKELNK